MKLDYTEYPTDTTTNIIRFYKNGMSLYELADKYFKPVDELRSEIAKFTRLRSSDCLDENISLLKRTEDKLIQMALNLKSGSSTGDQIQRYRGLLFWYTKADLNEGVVFIPERLLV